MRVLALHHNLLLVIEQSVGNRVEKATWPFSDADNNWRESEFDCKALDSINFQDIPHPLRHWHPLAVISLCLEEVQSCNHRQSKLPAKNLSRAFLRFDLAQWWWSLKNIFPVFHLRPVCCKRALLTPHTSTSLLWTGLSDYLTQSVNHQ